MSSSPPISPDFDPYYRWLGIPKGQRPPSHYRLLGISPTEEDNEVIKAAVEHQTTLVRNQKQPEQESIATRLLYEIQEAGMVILDPYRRKQYDAALEQSKPSPKQRSIPEPFPPYTPSQPVGEGNEIVRTYFGVMSIILGGFIIMALVSFMLPWRKFLSNHPEREEAQNQPFIQAAIAQAPNAGKPQQARVAALAAVKASPKQGVAQEPDRDLDEAESATIDATISAVDATGQSITVTYKTKSVALDVSHIAKITVDGIDTPLDALRPGQTATIEFDPRLDIAAKIEITSPNGKSQRPAASQASPTAHEPPRENDAALATIEVTLQQIDADGRKLTVKRNSKTTAFDVSRKAAIIVGGKSAAMGSLRPNQKASITFDPENEVVVGVEVVGPADGPSTAPATSTLATPQAAPPDDTTTVEATIASVDISKRTLSITRKTKTTAFDVARKAEFIIDGKAATLDALKSGQKASITINNTADVVVRVEVRPADSSKEPQK